MELFLDTQHEQIALWIVGGATLATAEEEVIDLPVELLSLTASKNTALIERSAAPA